MGAEQKLIPNGDLIYKGTIDASGNPNYPAARKGDQWTISVAGRIGGASGPMVLTFDTLTAKVDTPGGTHAAVGGDWNRAGDRKSARITDLLAGGATGFFTMTAGATHYETELIGAGGPGGSGAKQAAGVQACGGGGGAGGSFTKMTLTAAELLALYPTGQVPYQVGLGGAGGLGRTVNTSSGQNGTAVTNACDSFFGPAYARGGGNGLGGTTASGAGGGAIPGTSSSGGGGSASVAGTAGGLGGSAVAGGGGAGGGVTTGNAASNAGAGGSATVISASVGASGGTAGTVGGVVPTGGVVPIFFGPGPGAGGGASSVTGNAQNGADGMNYGGGGGGGGAARDSVGNSGAGGKGGDGRIRIVECFS